MLSFRTPLPPVEMVGQTTFMAWWWLVFGVTVVTLAICIGIEDYKCSVTGLEYIFAHCNEDAHIITQNGIIYGTAAIDIFTDLLILSLPFLILRGVTMPRKYKAILYGIFSLTVIVITVAVVRCIELKASQHSEIQIHSIDWLFLWSNIELGVAQQRIQSTWMGTQSSIVSCIEKSQQREITKYSMESIGKGYGIKF
ncbi:hypothetical protein VM1G_11631 [Cytospora mali]|uniref:Rhodopsin domain-containing protein n=1 Tax=Cytospora mali TaxID=578113 RepID=A0A194W096_CYTMA|nr:hypothetical protein VM1G_11631 [Valsa mali]